MNDDRAAKRIAWFRSHPDLEKRPSMKRRKDGHDYSGRCVYLFTLCTEGRKPLFGTLRDADADHAEPWILPSELGHILVKQWANISVETPQITSLGFQLMPDHMHGIFFVKSRLQRHIGHYVSRFKAKCTEAFRSMSAYSET